MVYFLPNHIEVSDAGPSPNTNTIYMKRFLQHSLRSDHLWWEISYDTDEQRETWDRVVKPLRTEGGVHVASVERAKQLKEAEAQATKRFFNPNGPKGKAWLAEFSKPACPRLTHR